MTVCVAGLSTNVVTRRLIRFNEPSAVVVADSRFSRTDGKVVTDRGQKIFRLSDFAIAGFSGDVDISHRALNALTTELAKLNVAPKKLAHRAQVLLEREWNKRRAPKSPTDVLIAVRYRKQGIKLFKLSSKTYFNPKYIARKTKYGVEVVGSGATEYESVIEYEMAGKFLAWQRIALGPKAFKEGTNQYLDDLTVVPTNLSTEFFRITTEKFSGEIAMALIQTLDTSTLESIGGRLQYLTLDSRGAEWWHMHLSKDKGESWTGVSLTPGKFK